MRIFALAAVALALSACGGGDKAADDANMLATDNLLMDENLLLDANTSLNGVEGMDANASTDAATENAMMKDLTTNDADTNLANGL